MDKQVFDLEHSETAWCPGCGNFAILDTLKQTLAELEIKPEKLVIVSGIGQAAKTPHYFKTNIFNGLHGRSLPAATAIKASNPELTVIVESGDGCMYGEGGNHLLHVIRRNPDITVIVHDNMVYGLTKGQASPTSSAGFKTPVQVEGVFLEPFNPLGTAIVLNASFVARAFAGDPKQTKEILKQAITHQGCAIVDLLQPCVTYNKTNTYQWFKERTYYFDNSYDPHDRIAALRKATEEERLALGVFYINSARTVFEQVLSVHQKEKKPLHGRDLRIEQLRHLIESKRKA